MAEPPITIRARYSSFARGDNANPTRVVIHATSPNVGYPRASAAGLALGTARYFASAAAGGSAHYIVDVAGEQHCVPDDTIAYHAPPNGRSIGIEICAESFYSRTQWLSPQVWPAVVRAASRTAELCARFRIPAVRVGPAQLRAGARGVTGHIDISNAFGQTSHTDPGPSFPWNEFMAAVTGGATVTPAPARPRKDDPVAPLTITPGPDGSFRTTAMAEAGASSLVVARSWVTVGSTFGTARVKVTALDNNGNAMGPGGMLETDLANNRRAVLELPSGVVMVTVEGKANGPGVVVAASMVNLAK
jgi:N-acetylmuramoyl-L-alanine amidase